MNIRDKLLNSDLFNFKEVNSKWHENPLFKFESASSEFLKNHDLHDHQIYLGLTTEPLIYLNDLKLKETAENFDLLLFTSRHTSKTARPAFLTHCTGNWGNDADFGGNPQELSHSSALLLKAGILSLIEQSSLSNLTEFSRDIEVTHHGPTVLEKPLIFMELGSSKNEWVIHEAGNVVSKSILETIRKYIEYQKDESQLIGLGFGGPHYGTNFLRLITNKEIAISISHICPKYHIQDLNDDLISQMISKNLEKVECFILDWKGMNSQDKKHLIPLLEEFDVPIKKTKELN